MYPKRLLSGVIFSSVLLLGACANEPLRGSADSAGGDASLTSNVTHAIQRVPGIGHDDLSVSTHDGVVTLRGRTQTRAQAQDAIEAARHVPGVQKVNYDIRVDD